MAVDFTYDPSTDIGRVRFRISDTRPTDPAFSDAEIQAALTDGGSVAGAMPIVLTALLSDRGRRGRTFTRDESGADPDDALAVSALTSQLAMYSPGGALADRRIRVTSMGRGPSDPRVR